MSLKKIILISALAVTSLMSQQAHAVSASQFKAGNIIDDTVFFDKNGLSLGEIQNFINSKVPVCDTSGSQAYGNTTRAAYGASRGYPAPYTCLKDYSENVAGRPADRYCSAVSSGTKSSAQIIFEVGQSCGINPRVLIVLLQKEQGLLTDDWPWSIQYRSAMGYGCPDTAACDSQYYGFFNQVYNAARQFQLYKINNSQYIYQAFRNNYIQWNPVSSCGGSNVYIDNYATSALYNYTPYQPNAAALNAGYGTGDSCSAYGNRNFWLYYNDWFGTTTGTPFFSFNGTLYYTGANRTYYAVSSQALVDAYGLDTSFKNKIFYTDSTYVQGMTYKGLLPWIARFNDNAIYVVARNGLHQFTSESSFLNYGYSFGQEAVLPSYLKAYYGSNNNISEIVNQPDSPETYLVASGKKQHISTYSVYTTTGSPVYSQRPTVSLPANYMQSLPNGAPVLSDGETVLNPVNGVLNIWDGTTLVPMSPNLSQYGGLAVDYAPPANLFNLLPQSSTQISQYVAGPDGTKYFLDGTKRYSLSPDRIASFGLTSTPFQTVSGAVLSRYSPTSFGKIVRNIAQGEVYAPVAGTLYHIYSEPDLFGLGYSYSDVSVITTPISKLGVPVSTSKLFAEGRLVRASNSSEVYLVNQTLKLRWVANEPLFINYGFSYNTVSVVPPESIQGYEKGDPLSQFASDSDGNKWIIDQTCKWLFDTNSLGVAYGLTDTQFTPVSNKIMTGFKNCGTFTNVIRPSDRANVYKLEAGKRRWITSENALRNSGITWDQVRVVSPSFTNQFPEGSPIQ